MRSLALSALLSVAVAVAVAGPGRADEPAADGKIRVLLTYGGHGFQQKQFFAMFDALPSVVYTKAPLPQSAAMFAPGLEKRFDVIVMYDLVAKIEPNQQQALAELVRNGMGVVSLHHNLAAHADWPEFRHILGGKYALKPTEIEGRRYVRSIWAHDQDINVTVADKEHPITRGLADFRIHDEAYKNFYTSPGVKVLLTTDHPRSERNIAWVNEYGKGRVFYLMLGHDAKAWAHPNYPEILARGIRWAAGRP